VLSKSIDTVEYLTEKIISIPKMNDPKNYT